MRSSKEISKLSSQEEFTPKRRCWVFRGDEQKGKIQVKSFRLGHPRSFIHIGNSQT